MSRPPGLDALPLATVAPGAARLRWAALLVGAALTIAFVPLAKVGGDQLNLLARGWLLAERRELVPYGNPLSIGGNGPGPVTSWPVPRVWGWGSGVWVTRSSG
jgi:hypothetical protein